ncbi:MAG: hypothetical protein KGZ93_10415 [Actinobacteria bacterium]|nr:hypothetical protein [Actinomycetota bacterium]
MNIVLRELKAHRKSLIAWSFGMFFLILTGITKFSGFANSDQSANDLFKGLPGLAAAGISKKPKRAAPVATGLLLAAFFLSLWLDITKKYPGLKYLTPFKYFEGRVIINHASLDPLYIAISLGIVAVMLLAAYLRYSSRDLSV